MTLVSLHFDTFLPTPKELQEEIPLGEEDFAFIRDSRMTIQRILEGLDTRKLLIVGPCSIHDYESAKEYAKHFRALAKEVSEEFFMVMRTYFEKPRSITGWKGFLYDPDLDGSHNLTKGIRLTRHLLAELAAMQIPTAAELLEMTTLHYYVDLLSWGCIGARTCSSPPHRQLAASLDFPIGFKNAPDGCVDTAIHGILSARTPHIFLGIDACGKLRRIQTDGNPLCHVVLRGGRRAPNYDAKSIRESSLRCRQAGICDKVLIDCSHDNCEKRHLKQIAIFQKVTRQMVEGNQSIAGLMLESNLFGGAQPLSSELHYGVSITDPCLDWESTRRVILHAAEQLCLFTS